MDDPVILKGSEMMQGALVGASRYIRGLSAQRDRNEWIKNDDFGWTAEIEAALAELWLSKFLGVYWSGAGDFGADDCAGRVQVRHTRAATNCLIVRSDDRDDHRFVLVTGRAPRLYARGWMTGLDAKVPRFLRDPNERNYPAYFVPQSELLDIETLRTILRREKNI